MANVLEWLFGQYATYPLSAIVLELIASVFGVASVLLARKTNIWVYPVGLVSTAIFVYLLWQWQLFGDMLMNAYYTIMSLYGWYNWSKNRNAVLEQAPGQIVEEQALRIERLQSKDVPILLGIMMFTVVFVAIIYYFRPVISNHFSFEGVALGLHLFTWVDYTDMLTTALFAMAMWLMASRKIENWLLWIIADAISVPLYLYKGLTFTAVQYVLFTLIAIFAYTEWRRRLSHQKSREQVNLEALTAHNAATMV